MESQPKKPLSVLVGLLVAESICVSAFVIELSRALSGNTLSWAYVFEWPILGGYAVYMWYRLSHDHGPGAGSTQVPDDEALVRFNEYLARAHGVQAQGPEPPAARTDGSSRGRDGEAPGLHG